MVEVEEFEGWRAAKYNRLVREKEQIEREKKKRYWKRQIGQKHLRMRGERERRTDGEKGRVN